MRIRKETSNIYVLTYSSRYELCMAFVRINAFSEDAKFKGKAFTLDDFMSYWVKKNKTESFEYTKRWEAFGIPLKDVISWYSQCKSNRVAIRASEREIVEKIMSRVPYNDMRKIYLIGMHAECDKKERDKILDHEMAHAMYFLDSIYRASCDSMVGKMTNESKKVIRDSLGGNGYPMSKEVFLNEAQAYLSAGNFSKKNVVGSKRNSVVNQFRKNFLFFRSRLETDKILIPEY